MRRISLFILTLLGLVISMSPVAAQSGSITEIVDSSSDLSRLSLALDTNPDLREKLSSGGSFTLFAPTDQAFKNLSTSLENLPFDVILTDSEVISAILNYHVIENASLSSEQIGQRSGEVVPTLLPGAFISFRLNDDQSVALNNVVQIQSSVEASNGWVHIIDDVLLNRVIDNLLAVSLQEFLDSDATMIPTVEPTTTEVATEPPSQIANIRFAHFASDVPAIDVYMNENLTISNLAAESMSDFSSLMADIYDISITLSNSEDDIQIESSSLNMADDDFVTLILTGSLENDSLKLSAVDEDFSALESDSRILLYHAIEDAPELTIAFADETNTLEFGDSSIQNIDADSYDLTVTDDTGNTIFEQADIEIATANYTFLALTGSVDEPNLLNFSLDADTVEELKAIGSGSEQGSEITETPEPPVMDTVLDILVEDDRFSLFVEALEAADSSVINRLASRNLTSITVLAPSNQAFENLFFSVRQSRVFGNRNLLTQILQYHIVEGEILASDFEAIAGTSLITLLQPTQAFYVRLDSNGEILLNNFVQFEDVDIQASNGVIHVIDDVLLPQVALDAWDL